MGRNRHGARGDRRAARMTRALPALVAVLCMAAGCDAIGPPQAHPEIKPSPIGRPDWRVTRRYSVTRVLIVEGECRDRERALEIAKAIVDPVAEAYDEVLVYVRPPDRSSTRRVQWTKHDGFRVLDY